ncbi:MAG: hypothetical protein WCH43_16205 [Verrucomicrobiota bacterium]
MNPSTAGNLSNLISLGIVMIRMVPMEVMARGEKLASMGNVICDSRSSVQSGQVRWMIVCLGWFKQRFSCEMAPEKTAERPETIRPKFNPPNT